MRCFHVFWKEMPGKEQKNERKVSRIFQFVRLVYLSNYDIIIENREIC